MSSKDDGLKRGSWGQQRRDRRAGGEKEQKKGGERQGGWGRDQRTKQTQLGDRIGGERLNTMLRERKILAEMVPEV